MSFADIAVLPIHGSSIHGSSIHARAHLQASRWTLLSAGIVYGFFYRQRLEYKHEGLEVRYEFNRMKA